MPKWLLSLKDGDPVLMNGEMVFVSRIHSKQTRLVHINKEVAYDDRLVVHMGNFGRWVYIRDQNWEQIPLFEALKNKETRIQQRFVIYPPKENDEGEE